jgi:hypothetical protein
MPLTKTSFKAGERVAGRAKGTPNKIQSVVKDRVAELLEALDVTIAESIATLTHKEQVDVYFKLLEYVTPKLARVEPKSEINTEPQVIRIEYV